MKKIIVITVVLVLLAAGSGCRYANARLRDAADCIGASVTVGPGFAVDAQATWLARLGVGFIKGTRYAVYYGEPGRMTTASLTGGGSPLFCLEITNNEDEEDKLLNMWGAFWCVPQVVGPELDLYVANPFRNVYQYDRSGEDWLGTRRLCGNSFLDVGFSVHIGYFGVEFRLKLNELADFLLGFTTLDISGDDVRALPEQSQQQESNPVNKS